MLWPRSPRAEGDRPTHEYTYAYGHADPRYRSTHLSGRTPLIHWYPVANNDLHAQEYGGHVPNSASNPSPNKWLGSGNWLRGIQSEEYLAYSMKERGEHRRDVHIIALNPHPDGWAEDLQLQLVCINDRRSMYVRPFKQDVPPDVDSFVVGMWDFASDDWMAGEIHLYYEPVLTNDGGSIYLNDQVQIQQVLL